MLSGVRRNATGLDESRNGTLYLNFGLKSGISGFFWGSRNYERLDQALTLGGATVLAGPHQFDQVGGYVSTSGRSRLPPGSTLRWASSTTDGSPASA